MPDFVLVARGWAWGVSGEASAHEALKQGAPSKGGAGRLAVPGAEPMTLSSVTPAL